jgi:hypothetical protein
MLTLNEYILLWKIDFAPHTTLPMPDYNEYVIREIQIQDYIDLFLGVQTFNRLIGTNLVDITTLGLGIYGTLNVGEYPWSSLELNNSINREIKYIIIGEAAKEALSKTYFYDIAHSISTPYFDAPYSAFCDSKITIKKEKLLCLANRGVFLIDIFPFSIDFDSTLRRELNQNNITSKYWNDDHHISTNSRLYQINLMKPFSTKWDLCFIAPKTISEYIINPLYIQDNLSIANGLHRITFRESTIFPILHWKKLAQDNGNNPNADFIKIAFNL